MVPMSSHSRLLRVVRSKTRVLALALLTVLLLWHWYGAPQLGQVRLAVRERILDELPTEPLATAQDRAKVGKITMLYGDHHGEMYERVLAGHERHAIAQGHEILVLRRKLVHGLWSKNAYILSTLLKELEKTEKERLQWLFWFDCDIVLLNSQIPLEIFLPPKDFRHINLIVTNDSNGLNSGSFFVKVNAWSVQLFVDIMALPNHKPEVLLKYGDQSAMEHVFKGDLYRNRTTFVPQRWFNAYRGPRDEKEELVKGKRVGDNVVKRGDLQVHFAGKETSGIKTHIPFWLNVSERREWEYVLHETTYEKEIKDFWDAQRKERDAAKEAKES